MTDETQPTTFPVTVEEWARGRQRGPGRFLVAGFIMHVRREAGLLEKKAPEAWDAACAAYATASAEPPAQPAAKSAAKKK